MIPPGFIGTHLLRTAEAMPAAAAIIKCDALVVQAIADIEAAGCGFLPDGRPKPLFERAHFSALTKGRFDATHPAISSRHAGGYVGGTGEYDRLNQAISLDTGDGAVRRAALESTSWGLPQIMGSNFAAAGYPDAESMVADFCIGEDQQLAAMARFIVSTGLADELQREDMAGFAARYNGPNYQANAYDKCLIADLSRLRAMAGASISTAWPALRQRAARIQASLNLDGYGPLTVDGWLGAKSAAALRSFQNDNHLSATGQADAPTAMVLLGQAA